MASAALRIAIVGQCADRVRACMTRSPRRAQTVPDPTSQAYTLLVSEGGRIEVDVPCTGGIELMPPIAMQHLLGLDAVVFTVYTGDAGGAAATLALLHAMLEDPYHSSTHKVLFLFETTTANGPRFGVHCPPDMFDEYAQARNSFHGTQRLVSSTDVEHALSKFAVQMADVCGDSRYRAYLDDDATEQHYACSSAASLPPARSASSSPRSARSTSPPASDDQSPRRSFSGKQCNLQ